MIAGFDDVLAAAKHGDEQAFAVIFRDLAPFVAGYLRGQGVGDPDDLVSETFIGVARNLRRFHGGEDDFRGWVFTIAHRRLVDDRRRRGRRKEQACDPATLPGTDATVSAEAMTLEDLDAGAVSELLDTLTPDQRAVVLLRVLGGFPVKDVARILGKRENAIKVLQHRAINALARTLERQGRNQVVLAGDGDTR